MPKAILDSLKTEAKYHGTSLDMLLAALLPATSSAIGTKAFLRTRHYGDGRLSPVNIYSIASAPPGTYNLHNISY